MTSASEGGFETIRQMQTRGGGGQKTRKVCRHHLSMAPYVKLYRTLETSALTRVPAMYPDSAKDSETVLRTNEFIPCAQDDGWAENDEGSGPLQNGVVGAR